MPDKNTPVRIEEFNDYLIWKTLPATIRGLSREYLIEKIGIEDENVIRIASIRTQKDFGKQYKPPIAEATLVDWNKLIDEEQLINTTRVKFANKMVSNVLMALYTKAMKTGNAQEVGMFMEYAGAYTPKADVTINSKDQQKEESLDEIENSIKEKEAKAAAIKARIAKLAGRATNYRIRTKGGTGTQGENDKRAAARKPA